MIGHKNIAVGLDVGTTKVCAVAAELDHKGARILGMGSSPSTGLRKGVVVNMDATVESIRRAVREAEASCGIRIKSATVGISGPHIKGVDSTGAVGIRRKEVGTLDVERAVDSARAVYIPLDREVLHVIPTEFLVDGQDGINDPYGMSGVRLEARVHIVTGSASSIQNLHKCCRNASLEVADMIFEPLASANATLSKEEMEEGVILIDIGGGTTDIALFREGSLKYTAVLGIGGNHFTNDIAVGLRLSIQEAERLKKVSGSAYTGYYEDSEEINVRMSEGEIRSVPRRYIAEILQPRSEELLEMIKEEILKGPGYEQAVCGVVLTGGASLLKGFSKMAAASLGLPVRLGYPSNVRGHKDVVCSPLYSTGVGLVAGSAVSEQVAPYPDIATVLDRMKYWMQERYTDLISLNKRKEGGLACLKSRK